MTDTPPAGTRLAPLAPAIVAATAFGCADVLTKLTFQAGADVLTNTLFRGFVGLPLLAIWLLAGARPKPIGVRATVISLGLGVLFAGNVYWLFRAIELIDVPIAILTYFVYPLLTGLIAGLTGVERLTWRGVIAAIAAFFGLTLMIGAHASTLALAGIGFALAAASVRVAILLITRASLGGTDPRLITWYSILCSTLLFVVIALANANWQPPTTALGWSAMIGSSVAMTVALAGIFISTGRVGPFRTALFMNLEPLIATVGSMVFLGEVITPLQALGGAVMIAALVAFQLKR